MNKTHVVCSRIEGKDFKHLEHVEEEAGKSVAQQLRNIINRERMACPICYEKVAK